MEPTIASAIRCVDPGARNRRPATPAVFLHGFRCTPAGWALAPLLLAIREIHRDFSSLQIPARLGGYAG